MKKNDNGDDDGDAEDMDEDADGDGTCSGVIKTMWCKKQRESSS